MTFHRYQTRNLPEMPSRRIPTPRGYLNDRRTKTIKIDREFGPVVAEAFERFANGTETIASLQQFLASKGMTTESRNPSRRGGPISRIRSG